MFSVVLICISMHILYISVKRGIVSIALVAADCNHVAPRSEVNGTFRNRWSRHDHLVHGVDGKQLQARAGADDVDIALYS